jgi:hypothetical protein
MRRGIQPIELLLENDSDLVLVQGLGAYRGLINTTVIK